MCLISNRINDPKMKMLGEKKQKVTIIPVLASTQLMCSL